MFDFYGRIVKVGTIVACTGKVKEKCTFVVKDEKDGREIIFLVFDQQIYELLEPLELGDLVKVTFSIKSREFGGKWETNCFAINIVKVQKKQQYQEKKWEGDPFERARGFGGNSSRAWGGGSQQKQKSNWEKAQEEAQRAQEKRDQEDQQRRADDFWERMKSNWGHNSGGGSSRNQQQTTGTDHFSGCFNKEDAKKRYRELSKKYHPDMPGGGDVEKMKEVNIQYARFK